MVKFFRYFPRVTYKGHPLVDITRRVNLVETFKSDPYAFLPYTIEGSDRPEDVANLYYGDVKYTWLVYLSNGIIDPYNEWPKTDEEFDRFIIKKYEEESGLTGNDVIAWTQNTTIDDNIVHYYRSTDATDIITTDTYKYGTSIPDFVQGEWVPLRYYDYELEMDNSKRRIYLANQAYASRMEEELRKVLNDES